MHIETTMHMHAAHRDDIYSNYFFMHALVCCPESRSTSLRYDHDMIVHRRNGSVPVVETDAAVLFHLKI